MYSISLSVQMWENSYSVYSISWFQLPLVSGFVGELHYTEVLNAKAIPTMA